MYRGIPHAIDLERCRRALVWREVEGEVDSLKALANRVGLSRSTVSRFFNGRGTSLVATLRILTALRLDFRDVASPLAADEGRDGRAAARPPLPASMMQVRRVLFGRVREPRTTRGEHTY